MDRYGHRTFEIVLRYFVIFIGFCRCVMCILLRWRNVKRYGRALMETRCWHLLKGLETPVQLEKSIAKLSA